MGHKTGAMARLLQDTDLGCKGSHLCGVFPPAALARCTQRASAGPELPASRPDEFVCQTVPPVTRSQELRRSLRGLAPEPTEPTFLSQAAWAEVDEEGEPAGMGREMKRRVQKKVLEFKYMY